MNKNKTIIITSGGTGGHVFPGLTIANYLKKKKWNIQWIGTKNHIESILVPKNNIHIHFINVTGFKEKTIIKKIISIFQIIYSYYKSKKIIQKVKPNIILGMGGYISIPGILAAWICKIPIIIHEQNVIAGLTNRFLSKISNKILQGFPNTIPLAHLVGNPIRKEILSIPQPKKRFKKRSGPIRILIIGGSQGTKFFNKIFPKIAKKLSNNFIFWHQIGTNTETVNNIKKKYIELCGKEKANKYKITSFIHNISTAYAWADLIICRSGAMTVSEITSIGLPALFIPFLHKDKQQYLNAKFLENIGAAKIINQSKFTEKKIITILKKINRNTLLKMAQLAKKKHIKNSTEKIIKHIISISKQSY
ncbi:MAG: N-acetylglucosaminyl transferase [Candidatus Westeberhardia cardiocondylae]|nr:N-acetylglucosaminyl transferase [Candidatus Westeberhardia cardiocondylae]